MTDIKQAYIASSTVTISLASLASDANLLAGRESDAFDCTTDKPLEVQLGGTIMVGTSPTTGKEIRVYVVGTIADNSWPDVFDGTDSAETISTAGTRDSIGKVAAVIPTLATSNQAYYFGPVSIASLFKGALPQKFVVFVTHNTGVNLNAGNHVLSLTPTYETTT